MARPGQRLDALDRLRDPDHDPRLPARGPPRRADARGGVVAEPGSVRRRSPDGVAARIGRARDDISDSLAPASPSACGGTSPCSWCSSLLARLSVLLDDPAAGPGRRSSGSSSSSLGDDARRRSSCVFVMMAVGLNIVVGYAGLLDLGYVAFYAIGAYTAAWLASGQFAAGDSCTSARSGSARTRRGIHISIWLVLFLAGLAHRRSAGSSSGCRRCACAATTSRSSRSASARSSRSSSATATTCTASTSRHGTFGISPIDSPGFGDTLHD